ncbi:hypothetical protein F4819DRAFT_492498 [Hypoxylon fuscum]|nr:hypothetical protein F4819DRAFT_492498 [Hypoxylon fuscum]
MDCPPKELLNNKFFKFIVGREEKEFVVHADVFARLSGPFNAMINGPFTEATERSATLDDIKESVFDRLRQFAYCGDYDGPTPEPLKLHDRLREQPREQPPEQSTESIEQLQADNVAEPQPQPQPQPQPSFVPKTAPRSRDKYIWKLPYSIHNMHEDLKHKQWTTIAIKRRDVNYEKKVQHDGKRCMANLFLQWFGETNFKYWTPGRPLIYDKLEGEPHTNFGELLACHAMLHTLADRYCIDKLAEITAVKLADLLYRVTLFKWHIGEIAGLINYVFHHTLPHDPIREMLICFGAVIIEDVGDDRLWAQMLLDNPEFSVGVLQKIVEHRLPERGCPGPHI